MAQLKPFLLALVMAILTVASAQ
ncbi:hypothetical protein Goklo_026636, partial [Gossypium klotzschianum]|nr:hypothetical protein [Gossypium klotzschianum]